MNSLLHNPLSELTLPYFLVLYVGCGVVGLLAGTVLIWLCDGTRDDDLTSHSPQTPDPYEVAFLAGGDRNVTRLVVFDLIEKGYLELSGTRRRFAFFAPAKMLRRSTTAPDLSGLTTVQRAAWDWVRTARLPSQILHRHIGLVNQIRPLCQVYVRPLESRRFLETTSHRVACTLVAWAMSFGIVSLGLYKLVASVIAGEGESATLILLMVVGLVCTAINCRRVRLSDLGHRYVESLQMEFGDHDRASSLGTDVQIERLVQTALFGTVRSRRVNDHLCEPADHEQSSRSLVRT